jgi:hypothetical protein
MQLTPKRCFAIAGALVTVVSFSRVCVLFLEALSTVRDERSQDSELLELCASGMARGSMKMRAACLQAQADRASPIVLKAVLRAVSTAYGDFIASMNTPSHLMLTLLFAISSIFMPVMSWVRALAPTERLIDGSPHIVVLADDSAHALGVNRGFRQRVTRALRLRKSSVDRSEFDRVETGGSSGLVEIDLGDTLHLKHE